MADPSAAIRVVVTEAGIDPAAEALRLERTGAGAVVAFTGLVRDVDAGLRHMELEHWPGRTEAALEAHAREAARRWPLHAVTVVHRHGRLAPGERIVWVGTASAHRAAAFAAADFLMDWLKSRAPFWKKEVTGDGEAWVEGKAADEAALRRW